MRNEQRDRESCTRGDEWWAMSDERREETISWYVRVVGLSLVVAVVEVEEVVWRRWRWQQKHQPRLYVSWAPLCFPPTGLTKQSGLGREISVVQPDAMRV